VRQNGGVTSWAEIESAPQQARAASPDRSAAGRAARRRPVRLKRTDRIVVGSIDAGAHVLQRRARHLLLGAAVFMLPMAALQLFLSAFAWSRFDRIEGLMGDHGYLGAERGAALVTFVVASLTAHLVGAYAARYLITYQLGGDPHLWSTVRVVVRRLPVLFVTWAVSHSWLVFAALIYLNGSLDLVGSLALVLSPLITVITAFTLFVAPVAIGEHRRDVLRRAMSLARSRFGAAYGFVWANLLVAAVLSGSITLLPVMAETTGLLTFGSYRWLFQGVAAQMALLVVVPFSAVATAQLYLQTRIQAEGLDIVIAADRVFGGGK
jgi:hypothetical protein